jgi:hypothetical protein
VLLVFLLLKPLQVRFVNDVDKLVFAEDAQRAKDEAAASAARITEELIDDGVPEMDHEMWFTRIKPKLSVVATLETVPGFAERVAGLAADFKRFSKPVREAGRVFTTQRKQIEIDVEEAIAEGTKQRHDHGRCVRRFCEMWAQA